MAVSSRREDQLLREMDILSSSEENEAPTDARAYKPVRAIAAALALCGVATIAAVAVLQPATMGNMRASSQNVVGLSTGSIYQCPTCEIGLAFSNITYTCGDTAVTADGCSKSGCQNNLDRSSFCIAPNNSELAKQLTGRGRFDYSYTCPTPILNNFYECQAHIGGCSLQTCEVGTVYDKTSSSCSQNASLSDTECGLGGCVLSTTPKIECYAPLHSKLIESPGGYQYICSYIRNQAHPYMCPPPPAQLTAFQCVLGTSVVNTPDQEKLVRDAQIGDKILVNHGVYEPIIDFLHALPKHEGARLIHIAHTTGRLSASAEHVIFVTDRPSQRYVSKAMKDVHVGDFLIDSEGQHRAVTDVVEGTSGSEGLFAPLTPSGTMIVDGVFMSNYASVGGTQIPHGAMHAAFFLLRIWRSILPASKLVDQDVLNPMAEFLWRTAGPLVLPASLGVNRR